MKVKDLLEKFAKLNNYKYEIIFHENNIGHQLIIPTSETVTLLYGEEEVKNFDFDYNEYRFVIVLEDNFINKNFWKNLENLEETTPSLEYF